MYTPYCYLLIFVCYTTDLFVKFGRQLSANITIVKCHKIKVKFHDIPNNERYMQSQKSVVQKFLQHNC